MLRIFSAVVFVFCLVFNANAKQRDDYVPIFNTSDSYTSMPISNETALKIENMKKSFGETDETSETKQNKNSKITAFEQYLNVNKDGSITYKEKGAFTITKKAGENNLLFIRTLPFLKVIGDRSIFYKDVKIETKEDITAAVTDTDKGIMATFKGNIEEYQTDKEYNEEYTITATILNLVNGEGFANRIDFKVAAEDFSIPVDKIFLGITFPETTDKIFNASAFVITGEEKRLAESRVSEGKVGFRVNHRLLDTQFFTASIEFDNNIDNRIRETLAERVKKVEVTQAPQKTAVPEKKDFSYSEAQKINFIKIAGFFTLGVFIYYILVWRLFGRDKRYLILPPSMKIPENLSPALAAVLYRGRDFNIHECLALSMINLAAKGFLEINYSKKNKKVLFIRTAKKAKECPNKEEKLLLNGFYKKYDAMEFPSDFNDDPTFIKYSRIICNYKSSMINGNRWIIKLGIILTLITAVALAVKFSAVYLLALTVGAVYILIYRIWSLMFKVNHQNLTFKTFSGIAGLIICFSVFIGTVPYTVIEDKSESMTYIYAITIVLMILLIGIQMFFKAIMNKPKEKAVRLIAEIKSFQGYMALHRENVGIGLYKKLLPYTLFLDCEDRLNSTSVLPDFFVSNSYYDSNSIKEIKELICN